MSGEVKAVTEIVTECLSTIKSCHIWSMGLKGLCGSHEKYGTLSVFEAKHKPGPTWSFVILLLELASASRLESHDWTRAENRDRQAFKF